MNHTSLLSTAAAGGLQPGSGLRRSSRGDRGTWVIAAVIPKYLSQRLVQSSVEPLDLWLLATNRTQELYEIARTLTWM